MSPSPWSEPEASDLRRLFPYHTTAALARHFGRSEASISMQANKMRLLKTPQHRSAVVSATMRMRWKDASSEEREAVRARVKAQPRVNGGTFARPMP